MSAAEQLAKLEGLLSRIRTNAARRRGSTSEGAAVPASEVSLVDTVRQEPVPVATASAPPSSVAVSSAPIVIEDVDIEEIDAELVESDSPTGLPSGVTPYVENASGLPSGVTPYVESNSAVAASDAAAASTTVSVTIEDVADLTEADLVGDDGVIDRSTLVSAEATLPLDLYTASRPGSEPPQAEHPTMEQLGGTVELEGPDASDLELDTEALIPAASERLEATPIPAASFPGAYDESLRPPPEAQHDLEEHDLRSDVAHVVPAVVTRSELHHPTVVAQIVDDRRSLPSRSFGALLEDSLSLTE